MEADIFVLELGIGVGLFARFFLDAFRDLCLRRGKDFYDRLTYICGDRSEKMLQDACRHGVLGQHGGHCVFRVVDALQPERTLAGDIIFRRLGARPFRAVFLNYILDCLPAAHLKVTESEIRQLCVRTCLGRYVRLEDETNLTAEDLVRMAASGSNDDEHRLLELYGMLVAEYDYLPVDMVGMQYGDFAAEFARKHGGQTLHNFGAVRSLERLLAALHPQGFVLVNDYGFVESKDGGEFEHRRFADASAVGLNFPLLKAFFTEGEGMGETVRCQWAEPAEDNGRIISRLLGHELRTAVVKCFSERFSKAAHLICSSRGNWRGRACRRVGLRERLSAYYQALERQPLNWLLMNEIAMFLTFTFRQPASGVAMAREALALNRHCSSDLWSTLGDSLFELGRIDDARQAYQRALRIKPTEVRARFNMAWVLVRKGQLKEALVMIAEALALDETGEWGERLLKKQQEVLGRLAQRKQLKYLMLANRVSKPAGMAVPDNKSVPMPDQEIKDAPKATTSTVVSTMTAQ